MEPVLITTSDVGVILGIGREQARRLVNDGVIPVHSTTVGGHRRYDLDVIKALARRGITTATRQKLVARTVA